MTVSAPRAITPSLVAKQYGLANPVWTNAGDATKKILYMCNDRKTFIAFSSSTAFRLYFSQNVTNGDAATWTDLGHAFSGRNFTGVKELPDGELQIFNNPLTGGGLVIKTTGWPAALAAGLTTAALAAITYTTTLTMIGGAGNNVYNMHTCSQDADGTVVISESGAVTTSARATDGIQGATRVWMSRDFGNNWTLIFDLYEWAKTQGVPDALGVHLHGPSYDKAANCVIACCGDNTGGGPALFGSGFAQVVMIDFGAFDAVVTGIRKLAADPSMPFVGSQTAQYIVCTVTDSKYIFTADVSPPTAIQVLHRTGLKTFGNWHLGPIQQYGGVNGLITRYPDVKGAPRFFGATGTRASYDYVGQMTWTVAVTDGDGDQFSVVSGDIPAQTPPVVGFGFSGFFGPTLNGKMVAPSSMYINNDNTRTNFIADLTYPGA